MTEEQPQSNEALERIRQWRQDFKANLVPSPLEDLTQLSAKLDLSRANPNAIARLFSKGSETLHEMFKEAGTLRAMARRLERVLDDQGAKRRMSGVAELSLVVGVAMWHGNQMPVLLYPVDVRRDGNPVEQHTTIMFTGHPRLNASLVAVMRENGVILNERELFDGSNYASGSPATTAVLEAITKAARTQFEDFHIEHHVILGCFIDPSAQILVESQVILEDLEKGPTGNTLLDALAGDKAAREKLSHDKLDEYSPFDGDPHSEYEVGDVDNTVRYAANMTAAGHSLFVDATLGTDTAQQAAAIASRCIMKGKSVLYVPCVADQRRRFLRNMRANELDGQVLDAADMNANAAIDHQLISAVGFQQSVAASRFDQLADELVGVRARLTRYLGDLHGMNETWNVSAYQTIQNLAKISELPTHPVTHVRLSKPVAQKIGRDMDEWSAKLKRAGELGEYTIGPDDTAWYKASIYTEEEAIGAYQRVVNLLNKILPATRSQVASTVETCGFPVPNTASEWGRQVMVLKNLRRVLDVFQPEIFERDIDAMLEATLPKAERKSSNSDMGYWERRRHIKEAKSMLRVGAQVEDLHDALLVVQKQAEQWRMFVPRGGWPVLPPKLDNIIATQDELLANMTALDALLATTPKGGDLESLSFNDVETRLKALYDDQMALDSLPERSVLEREFQEAGLTELVEDLHERHVKTDAVGDELRLAWWTTVFDDIVHSSAIISNQDGSVLQNASDRFVQVDTEHVRSVGPMIMQESMKRLCDLLFSRTQEANMLHTALASESSVSLDRIHHDHPEILAAAKPVIIATPATLASVISPVPIADVAIVDAAAHLPSILLLSILCRARQVVVLSHRQTITSESVKTLIDMLPSVGVKPRPSRRDPRVSTFLKEQGYGDVTFNIIREGMQGHVKYHHIEASAIPSMASSGLVESSQQEIDAIVQLITERANSFTIVPSQYVLTVVTLTTTFRIRLGAELKLLASKNEFMNRFLRHVRIVDITDVAGAQATDVILSMSYAKTPHGRLLQQFGVIESDGGRGMLLDALALADRSLDIVSAFSSEEMQSDRLHQEGPKTLKTLLAWAEHLDEQPEPKPKSYGNFDNVLFNDLAQRVRERGLEAEVNYGYKDGARIPLVVGVKGQPYTLAVFTDDAHFMSMPSTRERHRILPQRMESLGWSVMDVWSVAAFVNPEKEVDRIVARLGELYGSAER
ncbi:helicase [Bifidobacterium magnum]|uniref:DNA and RNA helicase related protein n=2 Tax=Bifidobacterium magnum TaxID=1692 RepID=A0A087BB92_9BIFI|nr:helicase [Bifidobacterium magnum]KFI68292.1 DNA and RNA helicase related protein [Bifidobacterium magnum]